jgi:N-acetylglucosamine kinase-like BadF-type ATPase
MVRYYLGVDIGATKSHALIADETGRAVGFGAAGPGNHEIVGYDGLIAALGECTRQALAVADVDQRQISGAGFGVGGYDWPGERGPTLDAIGTLGLTCPVEAVNDALIGLLAGAEAGWGVALISGTGNNCWGWDRARTRMGHVTGNGMLFDEYGGAADLVWKAMGAVAAAWSRRGPATLLTELFIQRAGAESPAQLLEGLSQDKLSLGSDAAPLVFQAADAGDAVAADCITWVGRQLGSLAAGVIRQLGFEELEFEVVQVGSMHNGGWRIFEPMAETIHAVAPGARFVRLATPPVVGAVLLGMEQAGLDALALRPALMTSTRVSRRDVLNPIPFK